MKYRRNYCYCQIIDKLLSKLRASRFKWALICLDHVPDWQKALLVFFFLNNSNVPCTSKNYRKFQSNRSPRLLMRVNRVSYRLEHGSVGHNGFIYEQCHVCRCWCVYWPALCQSDLQSVFHSLRLLAHRYQAGDPVKITSQILPHKHSSYIAVTLLPHKHSSYIPPVFCRRFSIPF